MLLLLTNVIWRRERRGGRDARRVQTPTQRPWPELAELWAWLERLEFDSLWLADHYVPPFKLDGPIFEPWTLLAGLAVATERVRLGVLVSCNTFRHPPLLAKEAVTVDHISGGRLEFGLGAGWFVPEHEMFGIPFPSNAELVGRFHEAVEICHQLFTQDMTTYEGTYYQVHDAPFRPAPLQQRLPFTLGAHGPLMMRIVARYADRWNSTGSMDEMRERNRLLDEACAEVGRNPKRSCALTFMSRRFCLRSIHGIRRRRSVTSWAGSRRSASGRRSCRYRQTSLPLRWNASRRRRRS
jgi:alkanesulfonate monooxygenase SsuD/methylene tetrahydromethanopterin reductase-like flavin-dependent oxidoreductase (luciferase family)